MGHSVESESFLTWLDVVWEEETFWSNESWSVNLDNLTIWKFVVLGKFLTGTGLCFISLEVKGDETEFLLDFSNNLLPG